MKEETTIEQNSEKYQKALNEYLNNGINYSANTIKNADVDDLQQLAADSFYYGCVFGLNHINSKTSPL